MLVLCSNIIAISKRVHRDVSIKLEQRVTYAEKHCVQKRSRECAHVWQEIKTLHHQARAVEVFIDTHDEKK